MDKRTLFLVPTLALLLLAGCGPEEQSAPAQTVLERQATPMVETATVERRDFKPAIQATGTLKAARHVQLTALSGGRMAVLAADIGTRAARDDLLFKVRTVDYELGLQQTEALLARAEVAVKNAGRELKRLENLFAAGSATEQQLDQARAAHEEALAARDQASAGSDAARQSLTDCSIAAPFTGVVTAKYVQQGEFVGPGTPVLEFMDLNTLTLDMELPERYAGQVSTGLPVRITTSSGQEARGTISAVNPKINPGTRTFLVKSTVDNHRKTLQSGLFCSADFNLATVSDQLAIPETALIRDEGRTTVWVVQGDTVTSREVSENGCIDGRVWITSGLAEGEQVITSANSSLTEGTKIAIKS